MAFGFHAYHEAEIELNAPREEGHSTIAML